MKKYKVIMIATLVIIGLLVSVCFIPINASKFIPEVEEQVTKDLGIQIHIEKLILRLGPALKLKAPVMHMMYSDGQKFAQFDNVRFFIPWSVLIKKDSVVVKRIYADKFIVKLNSDDKYLQALVEKLKEKDFEETPDVTFKSYSISYYDKAIDKILKLTGSFLDIAKIPNYKNRSLKSIGEFFINDKKYLTYDISVIPNIELPKNTKKTFDIDEFLKQMELLDFHSDIIADLKLYKNINGETQISGLVNVDNISVLDPEKKNPKSFIYLTFLGDKTGVLSNIYASSDKKVYIDGVINNSKKPGVDLKVKTDEIQLSDLYRKIKLLADCSQLKGLDSVSGRLKADFNIKGDLNKIKSSGYLKISDAAIKANGIDINKISSDIDFSNNVINITDAVGYVNNAPIMLKGKIDRNIDIEVLMNKVELEHLCPSNLGIKSGVASLVANISGTFDNIIHKENLQIDNFKAVNKKNNIAFSSLKIDTNKNNIAYINNLSFQCDKTEKIKLPLLKVYIERDSLKIPETNIFMPNSKLTAKAEVMNYNSKDLTFSTNLSGFINSRDIKVVKGNYATYPIIVTINGNKDVQNITGQLLMEKALILDEPSIINLAAKLENNILKIDDLSISSFKGKFVPDFKSNLKGQKRVLISGNIENLEVPVFRNIRVFIPQMLNITLLDTIAQLKGDIFINGKLNQPDIVGQISIQNLINQFLQLTINNMTVDFNKNIAVINAPLIKIADSSMGINSTVSTNISNELFVKNINIKSKYFNSDTYLMYKDSPLSKLIPINIKDGKFYAEKALINVYNSPLYMSALTSDFKLQNNNLILSNISSELFNGKLAGSLEFNIKDEHFNSKIQARGVSAAPIFDVIAIKKDTVSGVMDFDSNISGNISSKQSLNGYIKFIVHNGRMGTLGKLEHLLYAQNVIADNMLRTSLSIVTKAITLKDTGLFKYLRGDIILADGIAHVKMLQSQGPLMSLFIKGLYNPSTDYAKLVVLGRLSDEVISGLGAFGDFSWNKLLVMLTGEDNKYNILPEDFEKLPQLPMKNTKEFRSVINGVVDRPSSVILFNWISYSEKSYRQKDVPMTDVKVPEFIESMPY